MMDMKTKEQLDEIIKQVLTENPEEVQKYKKGEDGSLSALLAKIFAKSAINGGINFSFKVIDLLKEAIGPRDTGVKYSSFVKVGVTPEYLEGVKNRIADEELKVESDVDNKRVKSSPVNPTNEELEKRTAGFWKRAGVDLKKHLKQVPSLTKELEVERTEEEKLTHLFEKHNRVILNQKQVEFMDNYFKTLLETCEFAAVDFAEVTEKTKSKLDSLKKECKPVPFSSVPKSESVLDTFDRFYAESKVKMLQLENNCEELKTNYSDNLVGYSVYLQDLLKAERVMNRLENLRAALATDPPSPEVLEQAKSYLIEKNKFNDEKTPDLKEQLEQMFANRKY